MTGSLRHISYSIRESSQAAAFKLCVKSSASIVNCENKVPTTKVIVVRMELGDEEEKSITVLNCQQTLNSVRFIYSNSLASARIVPLCAKHRTPLYFLCDLVKTTVPVPSAPNIVYRTVKSRWVNEYLVSRLPHRVFLFSSRVILKAVGKSCIPVVRKPQGRFFIAYPCGISSRLNRGGTTESEVINNQRKTKTCVERKFKERGTK